MWPFGANLGDLERAVMDVLWDSPDGRSVRDVHERLGDERQLAYTTVMTVLDRLARKKVVTRVRDGRAWRYSAVASREEMTAATMRSTLASLDDGTSRRAAMLHFLGSATPEELAEVQAALAEVDQRRAVASDPGGRDLSASDSAEPGAPHPPEP